MSYSQSRPSYNTSLALDPLLCAAPPFHVQLQLHLPLAEPRAGVYGAAAGTVVVLLERAACGGREVEAAAALAGLAAGQEPFGGAELFALGVAGRAQVSHEVLVHARLAPQPRAPELAHLEIQRSFKFCLINKLPSPETAETKQGTLIIREIIPPYK